MSFSRRSVLRSAGFGAIAATLPAGLRLSFGAAAPASSHIIVFVLLRGGMDGLNLVAPSDDADLIAARPAGLRLQSAGVGAALPLANGPSQNDWRLHPSAPELKALYDAGHLAFVHASGIPAASRSHFQMQAMLERGVSDPTAIARTNGWIGQYAVNTGIASSAFAVVSSAPTPPPSVSGDPNAVSLPDPSQFTTGSAARTKFLSAAYASAPGLIGTQARTAIGAVTDFQQLNSHFTRPPAGTYANDAFGRGLSVIAEIIKLGMGLQVAEVEYSNWDTHVNQQPRFSAAASVLSKGLGGFYNDLAAYSKQVTIVVMSEFGRRVQSNADAGTDHGHGNAMLVLGGNVSGGRVYGNWKGLHPALLDQGDVPVTTDYRAVLSEVISATRGDLPAAIFPGLMPSTPLGLFVNA